MDGRGSADTRRFALSAVIALPVAVALLFLMTRLILPGVQDRMITRMIQNIEFQRTIVPVEPETIEVFKLPLPVDPEPIPLEQELPVEPPVFDDATEDQPAHVIDWWAEARRLSIGWWSGRYNRLPEHLR